MGYFIIAAFLILAAIVVVASQKFGKLAAEKGYVAKKARNYAVLVGLCALCVMLAGQTALFYLVTLGQQSGIFVYVLLAVWNVFVIAVMSAILRKAYANMLAAPDAVNKEI